MEYIIFAGAIIAVLFIAKLLAWPIKKIIGLGINIAIGIILLILFNSFGGSLFGFVIPINWITALLVGFLGIPGLILVILFRIIL